MPQALWGVLLWMVLATSAMAVAQEPRNLDFEADPGGAGSVPSWFVPPMCRDAGWSAALADTKPADGKRYAVLWRDAKQPAQSAPFGNLMQSIDAEPYRGKRLLITAMVRLGDGAAKPGAGRIQPWVRVDRAGQQVGYFDNCSGRPVTSSEWKEVSFKADIADDAVTINVGMMVLDGDGPACIDAVSFDVRERPLIHAEPPAPLTERGLANMIALARMLGYVRHYHPSDEAAALDWDRFTIDAVKAAEPAATAEELAGVFRSLLAPIAPTAEFQTRPFAQAFDPAAMLAASDRPTHSVRWKHRGFGPDRSKAHPIYVSERVKSPLGEKLDGLPQLGECSIREVSIAPGESLWMRIPIVVQADEQGTLPRPKVSYAPGDGPEPDGDDRSTRLAGIILGWNVLQHHFPYFDVIKDDWSAVLPDSLRSAAADADGAAFRRTLERMISRLHDGHGHVVSRSQSVDYSLPMLVTFVGGVPVVLRPVGESAAKAVRAGDSLVSIDGKPIDALIEEARLHEPAANEGNFHWRAQRRITKRATADPVDVEVRASRGDVRRVTLTPIQAHVLPPERGGPIVSEPRPGIWYVDLDRATDKDLAAAMPHLAEAKGLVLDMRGYPSSFSMGFLGHFAEEPLSCAKWEIPLAHWPDQQRLDFDHARWSLPPLSPPFTARTAFIIDGRAISAAETFMGIVEAYKLAEIVGEPTAGTNGNVNAVNLPGGYSFMFTGMKVLKHDDSRHHGIGILPTIPAHRTVEGIAAGKDEMLDRALDAVSR